MSLLLVQGSTAQYVLSKHRKVKVYIEQSFLRPEQQMGMQPAWRRAPPLSEEFSSAI